MGLDDPEQLVPPPMSRVATRSVSGSGLSGRRWSEKKLRAWPPKFLAICV
jgi:hypothetical protein